MKPLKKPQVILISYGVFLALSALLVLGMMLSSPSEPGNVILLGLSSTRLVLALGLFIAFVFFFTLTIKSARDNAWKDGLVRATSVEF